MNSTKGQLAARAVAARRSNLARNAGEVSDGGFAPVIRVATATRMTLGQMAQCLAAATAAEATAHAVAKNSLRVRFGH